MQSVAWEPLTPKATCRCDQERQAHCRAVNIISHWVLHIHIIFCDLTWMVISISDSFARRIAQISRRLRHFCWESLILAGQQHMRTMYISIEEDERMIKPCQAVFASRLLALWVWGIKLAWAKSGRRACYNTMGAHDHSRALHKLTKKKRYCFWNISSWWVSNKM
jgi:hypothetical protein